VEFNNTNFQASVARRQQTICRKQFITVLACVKL